MNSKLIITILTVFSLTSAFGQDKIWTKQTKISEVIAFEKSIDTNPTFLEQNVSMSKDYYPLADKYKVANPIIVKRKQSGTLPVFAEYFFTPGDSILRLVSYDWEKGRYGNFFDLQKIWKEESKHFERYNAEYERVKNELISQFGNPASTDTVAKVEKSDNGEYLTRDTLWESEDLYVSLNMVFASTTYRVRVTIYWKK